MTMTIPPKTEEANIVVIKNFMIDVDFNEIKILFSYGYKDLSNNITYYDTDYLVLDSTKYNQLLNATPPGNKTFKQWIRPLIYSEIANYLGVPVGQID